MKNNNGFTLLEVLIAIVLMAFIMLGVIGLINDSTTTKEAVTLEDRDFLQMERALDRFHSDFSLLYSPLYFEEESKGKSDDDAGPGETFDQERFSDLESKFIGLSKEGKLIPRFDHPDTKTLIFLANFNKRKIQNSKQSDYAWVKYTLTESEERGEDVIQEAPHQLVRYYYAADPYLKSHDWDSVRPQILLKNVKSLKFTFWSKVREKFVDLTDLPPPPTKKNTGNKT